MLKKSVVLVFLFMFAQNTLAADKVVKCEINSDGKKVFNAKCLFTPEAKGSFSLSNFKQKPLFDTISVVSVTIVEKDVAEVRGLTSDGINSRWGEARRSAKDKSCWVGSDFKVCAK